MKKKILKVLSIIQIVLAVLVIFLSLYYMYYNINYIIDYFNHETNLVRFICFSRMFILIILMTHCIFLIRFSFRIHKLNPDRHTKEIKRMRIVMFISLLISFVLQLISISSYFINILLITLVILEGIILLLYLENKKVKIITIILLSLYSLLIVFLISYSYLFCHYFELPTLIKGTSTKTLNTPTYQMFKMTATSEFYHASFYDKTEKNNYDMTPIPGVLHTETLTLKNKNRIETCTSMTPQGMVITDKYIYISSYCHTHLHNSVIYQMDKETNKLLKTIILPDGTHAGGLAYDNKNKVLWIATKEKNKKGLATVSCITQDVIDKYNFNISKKPIRYYKTFETAFTNTSFLTYHEGYLYTGLFKADDYDQSMIAKIEILDDGTKIDPEPVKYYYIPGKIQSVTFMGDKMVLSKSYGLVSSQILIYDFDENRIDMFSEYPDNFIVAPQMLEQIYAYDDKIYLIFESSSFSYRYTSGVAMDYIVSINKKFL